ncbi:MULTISPECIES: cytochrome C oxidase subunit IV family protein [unclassified Paenibacillus]|uniref:Cytochrome C oxidase subunit IV family protein n=1 Tax=Paenibacillus provencensis TaxID=441151 RepID=A0ABW3Q0C1_9BACL|nr:MULTISPECIES: cytochrome C oxidase subunit IV family protein [unclassified Paenibacillus]MCM3129381.1 cytochrome C oxidase subunit IV family protein [Paenibacillus sp. MER 78]SFS72423.1 cytochrome c oxidase subunit 4 [Paenibacillus sp. 453mf]
MAGNGQSSSGSEGVKHRHRPEGPEKHIVAFIFSIALTLIAFAAVAAGGVNNTFTIIILLVMAVLQVIIQMAYWMHMKDKGHLIPLIFMAFGFFVAFTAIITALLWMWW